MTPGMTTRLAATFCFVFLLTGLPGPALDSTLVSPPAAVTDLRASIDAGKVKLQWTAVTRDTAGQPITGVKYDVYRAQDAPYFVPAAGDPAYAAGLANPTFTDSDAAVLASSAHSTYYLVKALLADLASEPSNRVGAFNFGLVAPCPVDNVSGCYYTTFTVTGGSCPAGSEPPPGTVQVIQDQPAAGQITLITSYGDEGTGPYNPTTGAFSVSGNITDPNVCPDLNTCVMTLSGTFAVGQDPITFTGSGDLKVKFLGVTICTAQMSAEGTRTGCPKSGGCSGAASTQSASCSRPYLAW